MWDVIKNALISVKDATGIEIPAVPADLGAIGESATTAAQTVTESAAGSVAGVSQTAAGAVDSVAQGLPEAAGGVIGTSPGK
jgi:hypothetical protein